MLSENDPAVQRASLPSFLSAWVSTGEGKGENNMGLFSSTLLLSALGHFSIAQKLPVKIQGPQRSGTEYKTG